MRRAIGIIATVYLVQGIWSLVGAITAVFAILSIVLAIGLSYQRDWARPMVRCSNGMCLLTIVSPLSAASLAGPGTGAMIDDWQALSGSLAIGAVAVLFIGIEYVMRHPATRTLMGSPSKSAWPASGDAPAPAGHAHAPAAVPASARASLRLLERAVALAPEGCG